MKHLLFLLSLSPFFASFTFAADDAELSRRERRARETTQWLTNEFTAWLTNTFPEIDSKPYPDWLVNSPSRTRFPTWLTNTFPQIDTEEFPDWMRTPDAQMLARGIPDWWNDVKPKVPTIPAVKSLPAIIRGPYLQLTTPNSAVIRWRTDVPASAVVNYGTSPNSLRRQAKASGALTENIVLLTNLQPDTKYFYSIGVSDRPILVRLTNDIALLSTTNATLYVGMRGTNVELISVTNGTLAFAMSNGGLDVKTPEGRVLRATTNQLLVASTLNTSLQVAISNEAVAIVTLAQVQPLDGGRFGSRSNPTRHFLVGTTNATFVGGDSNTFFVTHPPVGTAKPTRVWVLGDPGTRKKEQRAVRDAYYRWTGDRHTDVWLMLGDNAYSSGKDEEYQGGLFQPYASMLRKTALWPTLGNHDAGSANSPTQSGVYYDVFTLPTLGQAGGVMSGTEAYYSFDYANIHFICLDSADSDFSEDGPMMRWLKADLLANRQDWLVAFAHHPPYTHGSHDSDKDRDSDARMRKMREVVVPLLERHGLDLMLVGHSHAYERSYLLDGAYGRSKHVHERFHFKSHNDGRTNGTGIYMKPSRGPSPHEGAVYVVAGSSGQKSGGDLQHPVMCLSLNVLGSLVLDFDGVRMDATFIDDQANVRDYFTIVKGTGRRTTKQEVSEPSRRTFRLFRRP